MSDSDSDFDYSQNEITNVTSKNIHDLTPTKIKENIYKKSTASRNSIKDDLDKCEQAIYELEKLIQSSFKKNIEIKEFREGIKKLKDNLKDQVKRFEKKTYEMGVIGKEKAGKSCVLNAWLQYDLLPSNTLRCTYTTTEIRSCQSKDEQRYIIDYFSNEEFDKQLETAKSELTKLPDGSDRKLLANEIKDIEDSIDTIKTHLVKGTVTKQFKNFDEVRAELKSAISDKGEARAVKNVCIYAPIETSDEDVEFIFYDVPGYDSPITLHKEQTKKKIESVDALLFATEFSKPSLTDSETQMLEISDKTNSQIKTKDKIIVVLTQCDKANSPREYRTLVTQNITAWTENEVPRNRIIPVCAIAELNLDTEEAEHARQNLKKLNSSGDTGFKQLKDSVKLCVKNSRNKLAKEHCDALKSSLKIMVARVMHLVKNEFGIDSKTEIKYEELTEFEKDKLYNLWWCQEWKIIKVNFTNYFEEFIRPKDSPDSPAYLTDNAVEFKKSYVKTVVEKFNGIYAACEHYQKKIYASCGGNDSVIDSYKANLQIRDQLASKALELINSISVELSGYLWEIIDGMIIWISKHMFNIEEIRETIIGKDQILQEALIKKGFDSLIQRIARPTIDLFLGHPRSKDIRLKVLNQYPLTLMILNDSFEEGKFKKVGIIQYLANGKYDKNIDVDLQYSQNVLFSRNEVKSEVLIRSSDEFSFFGSESEPKKENSYSKLEFSNASATRDEVLVEIKEDLTEFINCMKNSVFYGAGILEYFNQELDNVKRKFINIEENELGWHSLIFSYIKNPRNNVRIPEPKMLEEARMKGEIINDVKQLTLTMNKL